MKSKEVYGVWMSNKEKSSYSMFRSEYGHKLPAFNTITPEERKMITSLWTLHERSNWVELNKDSFCKKMRLHIESNNIDF